MNNVNLANLIHPEDKIQIFQLAIDELARDKANGFCHAIQSGLTIVNIHVSHDRALDFTPELFEFEPKIHGIFWFSCDFDGREKRISILNTLIKRIEDGR